MALATVAAVVGHTAPVVADLGDPGQVTLDKTVDGVEALTDVEPGESFTYSLLVGCDDNPCIDAVLTDALPAEFAGFTLDSVSLFPGAAPVTVTPTGCAVGAPLPEDCLLTATFDAPLGDLAGVPQQGIPAGTTYRINVQLTVPADLAPTWPSNGVAVRNTANLDATTSVEPRSDFADVTVAIPVVVDVAATKTWAAETQQYSPGTSATFTIGAQNTSNVPAESLVLQDPPDAPDGAATLAADSAFNIVDYAGLCLPGTLPQGADQVQVDLYTTDGTTWSWVTGTPGPTPVEPAVAGQVGGVRLTYTSTTGATIAPGGTAAAQCVETAQRATHRETGASLVGGATAANTVAATLTVLGQPPAEATAADALAITGLDVVVTPQKTITPSQLPASGTFNVDIGARNDSNGPLDTLTIREPSDLAQPFLSDDLAFDDFTGWNWPAGATSGTIVWHFGDGSSTSPSALTAPPAGSGPATPPTPPGAPPAAIVGFTVVYAGSIAVGAVAQIEYDVTTDPETVAPGGDSETFTNVIAAEGVNPAGADVETAQDDVAVFFPEIGITLDKEIRPTTATPGGTVLVELTGQTNANLPLVDPTEIVIEDVWDGTAASSFWDAFRARGISFTDVPAGAALQVEYTTDTPPAAPTWTTLASDVTGLYSVDFPPAIADSITGLRFTFTNPAGFAQGTIVQPNVVFEAAGTLRTGGPTTVTPAVPVGYDNVAVAQGFGQAGSLPVESDEVPAPAEVSIVDFGGGPGTLFGDKRWTQANGNDLAGVLSQSGATAYTRHTWGVTVPGYTSIVLSDPLPGEETTPGDTVFQAFDLRAIQPVTFAQDPLLRWDTVATVELFTGGAWVTVPAPAGSWMSATGFKGYTLTAAQSAAVTGVRVTVVENTAARTASTEPGRPAPGSGVAWSATPRELALQWQLRNALRVPGADQWVTADTTYNLAAEGAVNNAYRVAGTAGSTFVRDESDDIVLIDTPPGVGTNKVAGPTSALVPYPGDVPASGYPTVDVTVDAWNTAAARASYLRVADPVPCATPAACVTPGNDWEPDVFTGNTYDPATNPFEQFALIGVDFTVPGAVPVSPTATQVALWRYDEATGTTSVETTTMAALDALGALALADVVGVSVVYQSTDPATTGGLLPQGNATTNMIRMVLHTQLRPTLRSTGADQVGGVSIDNTVLAQSFDPVLHDPIAADQQPNATDDAVVELQAADLDVVATKQITPGTIVETAPDVPVTVTLGANHGSSTIAAETVTISDTDADFWAAFELTGLGTVTRPAGADLVRVDVQVDGGPAWIAGVAAPTATLPAGVADLTTVTGIRFVFFNDPVRPFSATAPSQGWTASAVLEVELRPGATFPGAVENTVDAEATHDGWGAVSDATAAGIALSTGTPTIDVRKEPVTGGPKIVEPGVSTPWTLTFTNTSNAFIGVEEVVDHLGPWLRYDGLPPAYDSTGDLPTDGITLSQSAADNLTFTFPAGARMSPGDSFTITVGLILMPGLTATDRAVNAFRVDTDVEFQPSGCTNTSGNGQGMLPWLPANATIPTPGTPSTYEVPGLAVDECGTTNFVSPLAGPLLFAEKEVRGEIDGDLVDGASNLINPSLPCSAEPGAFFRTVCVALTTIEATDEWRIGAVNTGTVPYARLTLVDVLPQPGDRMLATGAARQSEWRPVFDGGFGVVPTTVTGSGDALPAGAAYTVEVTTAPDPCTGPGPGSTWPSDPTCATHPAAAEWQALAAFAGDPADITAFRVVVDFTGTAGGALAPGGSVHFAFRTINTPQVAGEPTDEAVTAELWTGPTRRAWNQVGSSAVLATNGQTIARAPERTGVQLLSGSLQVAKTVSGDAAASAPVEIPFDVECTLPGGTPVDLGSSATLLVPTGGSARVDGVPLGASCTVTETGALGDFGEVARTPATPVTLDITVPGTATDAVAPAQTATFDNRYDFAELTVAKEVIADANPAVEFGPWDFSITCTAPFPLPTVMLDTTFSLAGTTAEYAVPAGTLPVGSTCAISETTAAPAVTVAGDGVADLGGGIAEVAVQPIGTVTFTNSYAVGTLEVDKQLTGDGVARYGTGPFEVAAECTYGGADVYAGAVTLTAANLYRARFTSGGADAQLPDGTSCTLTETATGGATAAPVFGPAATVEIIGGDPGEQPGDPTVVTVTNEFATGEIAVVKDVAGNGAAAFGTGPFVVRVECSYDVDGEPTGIMWNGVPYLDVELNAANDYTAAVDDLIVGAVCAAVAETTSGGASAVVLGDPVTVPPAGSPAATLTVTNTFAAGDLLVRKERTGDDADRSGAGPFRAVVTCTWTVDGTIETLTVPGGAEVVLSADNGYEVRVGPLPVGASCTVVESDSAGADAVSYVPGNTVTIAAAPETVSVTIVNRFDADTSPAPPGPTPPAPPPPAEPIPPAAELPASGSAAQGPATLAALLMAAGLGFLLVARTRRRRV